MFLAGSGLQDLEQMLLLILGYLILFSKEKNLIKMELRKKMGPRIENVPKNLYTNLGNLMMKILKLGKDYPSPIVSHEKARTKALNAFKNI